MSQWLKLLQRIISLSKDLRFDELRKVLEEYGYVAHMPKSGTSHVSFRKPGCREIITIPKDDPVKIPYVAKVKAVVEGDASSNENT